MLYDVIVVGGGIVGIGLFRDLSLHHLNCLLLEKDDFAAQTSQYTSKMLHGGIRYLENYDFGLVREALQEKNLWLKLAPDMVQEIPLCLPIYQESKYPLVMLSIGLKIYDLLSGLKNRPHQILNRKKTATMVPGIREQGLRGSGVYFDAIMDDHKLAMECLLDTLHYQASKKLSGDAHNYFKVIAIDKVGEIIQVEALDQITKEKHLFKTKELIFATGPYSDDMLVSKKISSPWCLGSNNRLLLSKGSHLYFSKKDWNISHAVVLNTRDGRIIFVIPYTHQVLVGTTEIVLSKDQYSEEALDHVETEEKEKNYLLKCIQEYFPEVKLTQDHIKASFCGVRPLVREDQQDENAHRTSRQHQVFQLQDHISLIAGGKYTTFRTMGQKLSRKLVE